VEVDRSSELFYSAHGAIMPVSPGMNLAPGGSVLAKSVNSARALQAATGLRA
jgi:hypothetical protein